MTSKHRHDFKPQGHTGPEEARVILFDCTCGAQHAQIASARLTESLRGEHEVDRATHRAWHSFDATFKTDQDEWKLTGYDLLEAVEAWAEDYPRHVQIVPIDDDHFSSSSLVLIDHKSDLSFMGTTAVVIPQNGGPPCEFFLYPCDRESLRDALARVAKQEARIRPLEWVHQLLAASLWHAERYQEVSHVLPFGEELNAALAASDRDMRALGGYVTKTDVHLRLGNGTWVTTPKAVFAPSGGPAPDFSRFKVVDYGRTLQFGPHYEAAMDAVLDEHEAMTPKFRFRFSPWRVRDDDHSCGFILTHKLGKLVQCIILGFGWDHDLPLRPWPALSTKPTPHGLEGFGFAWGGLFINVRSTRL